MPDPDGYLNRGQPISTVSKTMPVELPTSFTPIRNPMLPRSPLLAINQQSEGLRNYLRPGMRIFACVPTPSHPFVDGRTRRRAGTGCRTEETSKRPTSSRSRTNRTGYNKGTIRSDVRYRKVSKDVRRHRLISSDYIKTLYCHGRGRGFESRRPRHSFQKTCTGFSETIEDPKGHVFVPLFVSLFARPLLALSIPSRCNFA